jgi:benzil reductase ((S)-benzoin forming)
MNYFIITGASQGLGKALAKKLLTSPNNFVLGISRSQPDYAHANFVFLDYDLSDSKNILSLFERIAAKITAPIESLFLINNAGIIQPVGPIGTATIDGVNRHFQVNTISPALLSGFIADKYSSLEGEKAILYISSGVAQKAYYGLSCYCASKAAFEMTAKCLALEYRQLSVKIIDPGVIDTGMQELLRKQAKATVLDVDKFIEFKSRKMLQSADEAAEKIVKEYLRNSN